MIPFLFALFFCHVLVYAQIGEGRAGAYVRLNEKALGYLAHQVADGLPQLLQNATLPPVQVSMAKIWPVVTEFTRPNITAKFLAGKGVKGVVMIPHVKIFCYTEIDMTWLTSEENFTVEVNSTSIVVELHFERNLTAEANEIHAPECAVTGTIVTVQTGKDSLLSSFVDTIKEKVVHGLKDAVCVTAVEAIRYIDKQRVQEDPMAPLPSEDDMVAKFASNLCASEKSVEEERNRTSLHLPIAHGVPWSVDLSLVYPPVFTDEDVVFGVDAGVLMANNHADGVPPPPELSPSIIGHKMIGVMVSDYVPNTFFAHVYRWELGKVDYRIHPEALPQSIKSIARLLCSKCYLQVSADLIPPDERRPYVEIDGSLGARLVLGANVSVIFSGRNNTYNLINGTATMQVTMRPTVRRSRVYGDVALSSFDFDITKLYVGGAFSSTLEKAMNFLIPRTLWPAIKKRIRFALHQRGVQLPVLCAVHLDDVDLSYVPRAAILNTDFTFDLPQFIRKFKIFMNHSAAAKGLPPVYSA